jgi:acetyl-CoA acetyltransferase
MEDSVIVTAASQQKAGAARKTGRFEAEIVPMEIATKTGMIEQRRRT